MPLRSREITDQTTEARLREVIRYMVNQEVRRLVKSTSSPISEGGGGSSGSGVTETVTPQGPAQVWTLTTPEPPLLTTWDAEGYVPGNGFNTFQFNTQALNAGETVFGPGSPTVSYDSSTDILSIDWGTTKTGSTSLLAFGTLGYAVIATAEI